MLSAMCPTPCVARAQAARAPAKGRAALVVRANEKQGKGGEEGGKTFGKDCYGAQAARGRSQRPVRGVILLYPASCAQA